MFSVRSKIVGGDGRDGADHAADRVQSVRAARHDGSRDGIYHQSRLADVPDHGGDGLCSLEPTVVA